MAAVRNLIISIVIIACIHEAMASPANDSESHVTILNHKTKMLQPSINKLSEESWDYFSSRRHQDIGEATQSSCTVIYDVIYKGDLVNCSNQALNTIDPAWFTENSSTILLDFNNFGTLRKWFSNLHSLKRLSVRHSGVSAIERDALEGLEQLEHLDLEYNNLQIGNFAFPRHMFKPVPHLRYLHIAYNNDEDYDTHRPSHYRKYIDIFDYLPLLESLTIDGFGEVYLGPEFQSFPLLNHLTVHCAYSKRLTNESFFGLSNVTLRSLQLDGFNNKDVTAEPNVFQYLHSLQSLIIINMRIGNYNMMRTLWPFVNRTMTDLVLDTVNYAHHYRAPIEVFMDGMIYSNATEYLGQICVANFAWRNSQLYTIHPFALATPTLKNCTSSIDLSSNPLDISGWQSFIYSATLYSNLERMILLGPLGPPKQPTTDSLLNDFDMSLSDNTYNVSATEPFIEVDTIGENHTSNAKFAKQSNKQHDYKDDLPNYKLSHVVRPVDKAVKASHSLKSPTEELISIRLPPKLKYIMLDNYNSHNFLHMIYTIRFTNGEIFEEFHARNMPMFMFGPKPLLGLNNLRVFDFTNSLMQVGATFWDYYPRLEKLILSAVKPEDFFKQISCKRLLQNMTNLEYFDISNNELNSQFPETFESTPKLQVLVLAKNRFSEIPFDIRSTPRLEVLDLTQNAVLSLTDEEMEAIDSHVTNVGYFMLKLEGNGIVCTCSQLKFLDWLQMSHVHFDNSGNYSCVSENGGAAYTADFSDIAGFWRQCNGQFFFMVSLVLASLMAASFLLVYLGIRFRTSMIAFFLRIFVPQFRPKVRQDYSKDVFIGYADDDYRYVREILLRYLEDNLHMRTFVHQRDLMPGYKDYLFYEAIQQSWRILLVVTRNFLRHYDMADIVMKYASYSVSPVNQGRVFMLAETEQLAAIPEYLYGVLDDTHIILIPDLHQDLDYRQKEGIKNCLTSVT